MPQYLAPGVYVEEIAGPKPIEAVGTATGAFIGLAEKGPIGEAKLITNWTQFVDTFGGFITAGYLAYAVNQFFTEGGTSCYVVRTCSYDYTKTPVAHTAGRGTVPLNDKASVDALKVDAISPGSWSDHLWVELWVKLAGDKLEPTNKFRLAVWYKDREVEAFEELTRGDVLGKINGNSKYIKVNPGTSTLTPASSSLVLSDRATPALPTLAVTALGPGLSLEVKDGADANTFKLVVKRGAAELESYDNLTIASVGSKINGISENIVTRNLENKTPVPSNLPAKTSSPAPLNFFTLVGGDDGLADGLTLNDSSTPTPGPSLLVNAFRDGVKVTVEDATSGSGKFKLTVLVKDAVMETFDELIMDTVENTINGRSQFIEVTKKGSNRPKNDSKVSVPTGLMDMDFIGDAATKNGLHAFDTVDDINILAIPDRPGDREVIIAAYSYCQNRKDCFFVADAPQGLDPQSVLAFKQGTGTYAGNAFNSSYGALYYPWVLVTDPVTGGNKFVPPSGAVAGTYSSTDVLRGVHKAPAGTIDGYLNSAVGIERLVTKGEQELLNPNHVNVIRSFPGSGIVVWGARTLSAGPEWRYVNVRRLLLFIEESIDEGSQWVVFEPNDRSLWARVKRDITAFLTNVWRSGALFGSTQEEAFFVKIDDENNPPEVRDAGQLIIDIAVAPVKPAEFVIFRITQRTPANKK